MTALRAYLSSFRPPVLPGSRVEHLRAALGAFLGIAATGVASAAVLGEPKSMVLLLIAPMGASAVLLFAAPTSPLAQPWSIMAGNCVSALIGVACLNLVGYSVLSAALAVSLAIAVMFVLRCLHPPGGASALAAVLGAPMLGTGPHSFVFVLDVAVNSAAMLAVALLFNNLTGRRYPHVMPAAPAPAPGAPQPATVTTADLAEALALYEFETPMTPRELDALYRLAERRRAGRAADRGTTIRLRRA